MADDVLSDLARLGAVVRELSCLTRPANIIADRIRYCQVLHHVIETEQGLELSWYDLDRELSRRCWAEGVPYGEAARLMAQEYEGRAWLGLA